MPSREPSILVSPDGSSGDPDPAPDGSSGEAEGAAEAPAPAVVVPAGTARRSPRAAAPTFHVAGFWRRAAAAVVDGAVVVPVGLLLALITTRIAGVRLPPSRHRGLDFWLDLLLASDPAVWGTLGLVAAIVATYLMVFHITMGRTPGMRLLRMRVIDVYGDPPSVGRSVARTLGYLAAAATLGLGFLWIGFDSEKRGLHDWVSGTYVVKA